MIDKLLKKDGNLDLIRNTVSGRKTVTNRNSNICYFQPNVKRKRLCSLRSGPQKKNKKNGETEK